jgi:hypothetical protein
MGIWKARYRIDQGMKEEVTRYAYHLLERLYREVVKCGNIRGTIIMCMNELNYYKIGTLDSESLHNQNRSIR